MLADKYVFPAAEGDERPAMEVAEPEVFPDLGIWHPLAPSMFEDLKEYLNWTSSRTDLSEKALKGPVIGLVLQRSHIVTGDDAHYVAIIQELEFRGARVLPIFCGGLDFSKPVNAFFFDPLNPEQPLVDGIVSLTGFALVGGPARQDHPKAIESLKKLNRPYMVALPLVFQTTQEWEQSDLGLHPVQVALQIAIPELDGAIEPIVLSGRDDATGKAHTLQDRVDAIAERAIRWSSLRIKPRIDKKLAITVFSFPPDKGNVGTAAYLDVFGSIHRVMQEMKAKGYDVQGLPSTPRELLEAVINDADAMQGSPELSIAHRMSVEEYEHLTLTPRGLKRTGESLPAISTAMARICWSSVATSAMSLSAFSPPSATKATPCACFTPVVQAPTMVLLPTTPICRRSGRPMRCSTSAPMAPWSSCPASRWA